MTSTPAARGQMTSVHDQNGWVKGRFIAGTYEGLLYRLEKPQDPLDPRPNSRLAASVMRLMHRLDPLIRRLVGEMLDAEDVGRIQEAGDAENLYVRGVDFFVGRKTSKKLIDLVYAVIMEGYRLSERPDATDTVPNFDIGDAEEDFTWAFLEVIIPLYVRDRVLTVGDELPGLGPFTREYYDHVANPP